MLTVSAKILTKNKICSNNGVNNSYLSVLALNLSGYTQTPIYMQVAYKGFFNISLFN